MANVQIPVVKTGRTTLAIYPDWVLAFLGRSVGTFSYAALKAEEIRTQFVEIESVPRYASVIDHTWQYVDRNGGADRRFKNNRKLPGCAYTQLNLSTATGLDVRLVGSRERGFASLPSALGQMA